MKIRQIPEMSPKDVQRFFSKIRINPENGCHEWQASLNASGYGGFQIGRGHYPAHRVAYVLAYGEPAEGLVIDHKCKNRRCVNAVGGHLRPLTLAENTRLGTYCQKQIAKTHCPRGHRLADFNLIPSLLWAGRACRSCDIAARAARHKRLKGQERERFIQMRADERYERFLQSLGEAVAA